GLVGQEQGEGPGQAEGDRRLLPHALGEVGREVVDALVEPEAGDEVGGRALPVLHAVEAGDVLQVLFQAEVVVEDGLVTEVRRGAPGGQGAGPGPRTSPSLGSSRPATQASSVDFPAPLGPTRATNSPSPISRSIGPSATRV